MYVTPKFPRQNNDWKRSWSWSVFQLCACEYNLRGHSMKLSKQRASLDVWKFSFSQRVVQEWDKLHQEVIDATSVNQFKNRLDKY